MIITKQGVLMTHAITLTAVLIAVMSWQQVPPKTPDTGSTLSSITSLPSAWP